MSQNAKKDLKIGLMFCIKLWVKTKPGRSRGPVIMWTQAIGRAHLASIKDPGCSETQTPFFQHPGARAQWS